MILVVDDDNAIRMSVAMMLEHAGLECVAVGSEQQALDAVRTQSPELVILDMNLRLSTTGRDGLELLRKIRVLQPHVPVILITAWGTIQLAVEGMSFGAADFITKPWRNIDFMARMRKVLEGARIEARERMKVPTLEEVERRTLIEAIDSCNGNMTAAATLLGITRQSLYRRVEKYGIAVDYKT